MLSPRGACARAGLVGDGAGGAVGPRHATWALGIGEDAVAARTRPDEPAAVRRFNGHLAEVRRAHAWLCAHGPLEDLLRLGTVCADVGFHQARIDLVRLADTALRAAGCDPDGTPGDDPGAVVGDGRVALHPLLPRLLARSAAPLWQRGDVDGAARRCRRALALADRIGDPQLGRDAWDVLTDVASFQGELAAAEEYGHRTVELARAAGDDATLVMALCNLTLIAAYAGQDAVAARHEAAATALADRLGSPNARGWVAYAAGERRAEIGSADAAAHLEQAVALAGEVDSVFLAGVARHTLLTTAARVDDPARAPSRFGPLLDTWHGMGAWTQLWIAARALAEALSRHGRHRDAAVLVGALRTGPRGGAEFGADSARLQAVVDAAAGTLGPELGEALAAGAALDDTAAIALARRMAG